ncbi:gap junction beta-2 protein-like [Leucoraja erinacea]|uniref:gap junction beta-2 protein-like n=1 Tax=Leucoraja erinaceus TaxID=7782 RepID=UPI002453D701|nr:gap junction beta-2 protein-like [Leucoraja erinacea]
MELDIEMICTLLSGSQPRTPIYVKSSLALLFVVRLIIMIVTAKTTWNDDLGDLICNSTRVGCRYECYNNYSIISPFNLFALQLIFIISLLIAVAFLQNPRQPIDISCSPANSYCMLARMVIEGAFLVLWPAIYHGLLRQPNFKCDTNPCEQTVVCTMLQNQQKNAFVVVMYICSLACLFICATEKNILMTQVVFFKSSSKIQKIRNSQYI